MVGGVLSYTMYANTIIIEIFGWEWVQLTTQF